MVFSKLIIHLSYNKTKKSINMAQLVMENVARITLFKSGAMLKHFIVT